MKTLKTLFFSLITILLLQSCQTDSLQKFFVDSQNDDNFMSIDIPTSLLGISSDMNLSEEELITLKSVKKINMLMLEASQYNQEFYSTQKERLNTILKSDSFTEILKFRTKGMDIKIYFTGQEDAIDELIVFGYNDDNGMGVARVLGKKMNLNDIMNLSNKIDIDPKDLPFGDFESLMGI
jgi:hypothetical protein